ncbi:hypothetical protein JCM19233_5413 [Vibrio astriarenae]|nr:hypothetical protein JCM19233_5413 [Vibrio sp. C7]
MLECWFVDDRSGLLCEASWSDGSDATNYDLELFDYDDNLLARGRTDAESQVRFDMPEDDFYVVFDPGHEAPAEVDVVEVKDI